MRHLERNHKHEAEDLKKKKEESTATTSLSSKKRKSSTAIENQVMDPKQPKITEFTSEPPIMRIAVNLCFRRALSFNEFDSSDMKLLVDYARLGAGDRSKEKVNAENVKNSLQRRALSVKDDIISKIHGKIVSLTGDFATLHNRSFLGKKKFFLKEFWLMFHFRRRQHSIFRSGFVQDSCV